MTFLMARYGLFVLKVPLNLSQPTNQPYDVYETKFTVGKSKEMVFTEGKRRDGWGKLDTLGEIPPRDV